MDDDKEDDNTGKDESIQVADNSQFDKEELMSIEQQENEKPETQEDWPKITKTTHQNMNMQRKAQEWQMIMTMWQIK